MTATASLMISPPAQHLPRLASNRQLRLNLVLTNPKAYPLTDQALWFYLPATDFAQQLTGIQVSVPYKLLSDKLGHNVLNLVFPEFPALATKIITIELKVERSPKPIAQTLLNPQEWLQNERYIETADPAIQALAARLQASTPLATAQTIYQWLRENIHATGYLAEDRGAAQTLQHHQGDCTDLAYLAVALARVNKIPARMVGGYVADKNMLLQASAYHNWAEFYVADAWRLLDAQKGNWLTAAENYIAFRFYRAERINPIDLAHRYQQNGALEIRY